MPKREIIETGKTVDAVIEAACEKLGCSRDECGWEIIDLPKKSFLGLKVTPAKVRVWYGEDDEPVAIAPKPAAPKPEAAKPEAPKPAAPKPEAAKPAAPKPAAPKPEAAKQPAPKKEHIPSVSIINPEKTKLAEAYIAEILEKLGLTAELDTTEEDDGICINITGKGLGAIIGRRGETLDAIQYLASLVANRTDGDYMRITIDCGDYRTKRKETLEALAKKLAAQVLKTNVSRTLEPMNPFERRIIHATISEIEGVSSTSVGDEPNRRVVITSPTAKSRGGRSSYRGRDDRRGDDRRSDENRSSRDNRRGGDRPGRDNRSGGGRDSYRGDRSNRRDRGDRSNNAAVQSSRPKDAPPKQTLESMLSTDKPLYTKIDLD